MAFFNFNKKAAAADETVALEPVSADDETVALEPVSADDETVALEPVSADDDAKPANPASADETVALEPLAVADDAAVAEDAADDVTTALEPAATSDDDDVTPALDSIGTDETVVLNPVAPEGGKPAAASDDETGETTEKQPAEQPEARGKHAAPALALPIIGPQEPVKVGAHAAISDDDSTLDDEAGFEGDGAPEGAVVAFELPKNRSRKAGKIAGITIGALAGVVAIVYLAGAAVFSNWFMPNTTAGDLDLSLKSSEEAAQMIEDAASAYALDVTGGGFSYSIDAKGLGLSVDAQAIVDSMHQDLNSWTWPALIAQPAHDETGCMQVTYKPSNYQQVVRDAVATFNEQATPPTNATIEYDEKKNQFRVKSEVIGTQLDANAVLAAMADAVEALEPKVQLGANQLLQPAIVSTDEKLKASAELATGMASAKLTLTLDGKEVRTIDSDSLAQFISMGEGYEVVLDEDALYQWVEELSWSFNTVGSERTYVRADGKEITVAGGTYGWEVDAAALRDAILEGVKAGQPASIEIPCLTTAYTYEGTGARDWGARYVDIDLAEQYVRFYDWDGSIIWESACISGKPDGVHDTSVGVFVLNDRRSPAKLEGWENGVKIYTTQVTYWMPFDGNAIGMHDADWQPAFGGTMYADGYGSHGCVNLPPWAAAELFYIIEVGDVVVSHW